METVPFGSRNVTLPLALLSLKGEELPRKNDSYGSQRIYYTSGFHSFLPFKKRQTYCKGAQQACTVMLSFPLKQHVLFRKYSPQLVLNTLPCWSENEVLHIKAIRIISQKAWLFLLNPTVLLSKKACFLY